MDFGEAAAAVLGTDPTKANADNSSGSQPGKLPQDRLNDFWNSLITKSPGKVFQIFPHSLYASLLPPIAAEGVASRKGAAASYEEAAQKCKDHVQRIVEECHRSNEKFTDPDFDIEHDWKSNCLKGLKVPEVATPNGAAKASPGVGAGPLRDAIRTLLQSNVLGPNTSLPLDVSALQNALEDDDSDSDDDLYPATAHRVDYIFDNPSFLVDGFSSSDVQQGANGDCWWVAAVATLCSMPDLMHKVCVARDAECGVYGFVFFRDGEWISTVVDDNLYLSFPDFDAYGDSYDPAGEEESKYKKRRQTGSEALYFAKCHDENETWLPLLEKAYAKIHGDYDAIQGGFSGDAVEDMTGGVTTTIETSRILSKDKLWKELLNEKKEFIFGASPHGWWIDRGARQGVPLFHAYSILEAVEPVGEDDKKVRLVKLRNPWGQRNWRGVGEWTGPWSDGSKEWTLYWMKKLNHKFGDDGVFWISFDDLCRKFSRLSRTRLFGDEWVITQQWTSVNVSWVSGYLTTKFILDIKQSGTVVIVLSQLDSRYFKGLEGQYSFQLQFLVRKENDELEKYLLRAHGAQYGGSDRSISAEIDLPVGTYEVLPKLAATRDNTQPTVDAVVKLAAEENPQKLRQIGLNYDIAHAKGGFEEEQEERKQKLAKEKKAREEKEKKKLEEREKEAAKDAKDAKDANQAGKSEEGDTKSTNEQGTAKEDAEKGKEDAEKGKEDAEKGKEDAEKGKEDAEKGKEDAEKGKEDAEKGKVEAPAGADDKEAGSSADKAGSEAPAVPDEAPPAAEASEAANPWNAVAVIGLLVYSKDPELAIRLVKPKDPEETALLDVDGGTSGAGATT